jgi:hypothetical protein
MNYTDLLLKEIGRPAVEAIRALDAGVDPRTVYLAMREKTLPPALAGAMREVRRHPEGLTTDDLRALLPDASPATLCNRLAALEEIGLLAKTGQETVKGGGRRFVYCPWDGGS